MRFEIRGIDDDLLKNVQSRLTVLQESYGETLSEIEVQKLFQQSPQEIRRAIEPYGYFRSNIRGDLLKRKSTWIIRFYITSGPAIRISEVHLNISGEGSHHPALQKLAHDFPLKVGQIFQAENYENAKEELFKTAGDAGYIKSYLEDNKVLIDLKKYSAQIVINFQTGPLYYFGPVSFSSSPYAPVFLRRFISVHENMPFSSQKLVALQQKLASSFYFKQVLITPDFTNIRDCRVPLLVFVEAPKARKYSLGVGYGTFTGPRITGGVSFRRIGDTGQHLDAQIKLSKILSGLGIKYYIPGRKPLTDQWVIGTNYQKFKPENGVSNSASIFVGYNKKFHRWQTKTNLTYLIDRYKVRKERAQFSKLLYPSLNISYVKSDDPIVPLFGKSLHFTLQGASQNLLSTTSFIQAEIKGKYLYSPASFAHILLRGDLGYTATRSIKALPFSMRFFAGGLSTVRGYEESSIGPGRYLKVASVEYQNKIYGNFNAAIFYDMGVASNHFNDRLLKGEGVGLIYNSVIGPIKMYVARAMSKHKKPYEFEFSIGPEF